MAPHDAEYLRNSQRNRHAVILHSDSILHKPVRGQEGSAYIGVKCHKTDDLNELNNKAYVYPAAWRRLSRK